MSFQVGDLVVHDHSRATGKITNVRDNILGYSYFVVWDGDYLDDWYRAEVLSKHD